MPKIKPERVAGIVALSYLVLIPAAGLLMYQKIRVIDRDVLEILDEVNRSEDRVVRAPFIDLTKLMQGFKIQR